MPTFLRTGGRLTFSDIVLTRELPASVRKSVGAYVGCVAGALQKDTFMEAIRAAGFANVEVIIESPVDTSRLDASTVGAAVSVTIRATKV